MFNVADYRNKTQVASALHLQAEVHAKVQGTMLFMSALTGNSVDLAFQPEVRYTCHAPT